MGIGMEASLVIALLVFTVTNLISIAMTIWFIKMIAPIYKPMMKQMKQMYIELEKTED